MNTPRFLSALVLFSLLVCFVIHPAPAAAEPVMHQVVSDDNLHLLAAYYYRDPRLWDVIRNANRGVVRNNASLIPVGTVLTIPAEGLRPLPLSYGEWRALVAR